MEQNSSKIQLKDILELLGIIGMGVITFIAATFFWEGSLYISIPIAIVMMVALAGIVYLLVGIKSAKRVVTGKQMLEYLLVFVYTALALVSLVFVIHFFNVQMNIKDKMQVAGKEKVEGISTLFNRFDEYIVARQDEYKAYIDRDIREGKYANENPPVTSRSSDREKDDLIGEKLIFMKEKLNDEISVDRAEAEKFVSEALRTIDHWNPFKISTLFKTVDVKLNAYASRLTEACSVHPHTENNPFKYKVDDALDMYEFEEGLTALKTLNTHDANWIVDVLAWLILHFLILFPYLFTVRDSSDIVGLKKDSNVKEAKKVIF